MQPIRPSGKKAKEFVTIYSSVAELHPQASALAARCIAIGCQIESLYGAILTTILGANAAPASAMYGSLGSIAAQYAVVQAAAEAVLDDQELDVLEVVSSLCNTALKHRNKFAHWVWGISQAYPESIVLIDPKALLAYETGIGRFMYPNEGRGLLANFDVTTCWVYNKKALQSAVNELRDAEEYLALFRICMVPETKTERSSGVTGLQTLIAKPAVAKALQALAEQQQKNQAKPRQRQRRGQRG